MSAEKIILLRHLSGHTGPTAGLKCQGTCNKFKDHSNHLRPVTITDLASFLSFPPSFLLLVGRLPSRGASTLIGRAGGWLTDFSDAQLCK